MQSWVELTAPRNISPGITSVFYCHQYTVRLLNIQGNLNAHGAAQVRRK